MHEMVTSVKFAPETRCVNTGLTYQVEPGSIYPSDHDRCAVAGIAQIAQIAEVWFPYNRWDR